MLFFNRLKNHNINIIQIKSVHFHTLTGLCRDCQPRVLIFGLFPVPWDIPVELTLLLCACRRLPQCSTHNQVLWLWRTPHSWNRERSLQPGHEPETEGCPPEPGPGNTGRHHRSSEQDKQYLWPLQINTCICVPVVQYVFECVRKYPVQQYIVDRLLWGEQRELLQKCGVLANDRHLVELPAICNKQKFIH